MIENLVCLTCKHFRFLSGGCAAFPNGIPDEIIQYGNKHKKPLPEQENDIVYEEGEPKEE
jgi:hypothetical protein